LDEQRPGSCLDHAREGGIDFVVGACFQYLNLSPDDASPRQQVSRRKLKYGIVRIPEKTDRRSARYQLVQQRDAFAPQFTVERVEACEVVSWPIEAGNKPKLHRIGGDDKHNWDAGGRSLRRASRKQPACDDHSHLKLDQISRQRRQSISLVLPPTIFDHKVPAFNVSGLVQPAPEAGQPKGVGLRRPKV
jgi:hypothetical protein